MQGRGWIGVVMVSIASAGLVVVAQQGAGQQTATQGAAQQGTAQQGATPPAGGQQGGGGGRGARGPVVNPEIATLVGRLDLEKYKATLKGLTEFGDRREGTQRNRNAVDWIEAQLKSYGCTTERIKYDIPPRAAGRGGAAGGAAGGGAAAGGAAGGGAAAGAGAGAAGAAGGGGRGGNAGGQAPAGAGAQGTGAQAAGGQRGAGAAPPVAPTKFFVSESASGTGVAVYGYRGRTGVNSGAAAQPDEKLRALDSEPVVPGPVDEVFCTKIGTTHPEEMYIVGGHMDGIGYGQAANDDGSGTTVVMELARIFSSPDVVTERTIRFCLWNGEEGGLHGAHAYVDQRKDLQGIENPKGSGKYPEPKWLGMIQHDMMMWDHGAPRPDGSVSREQRPEADVNIEFQASAQKSAEAMKLAWFLKASNEAYATDYPANVGPHMSNTDSDPFMHLVAAVSLRENERLRDVGSGWDPNWHQPTDVFSTYYDKDFRLGLNAAQTTLSAIAQLVGAKLK
jgi:hypothetical protein